MKSASVLQRDDIKEILGIVRRVRRDDEVSGILLYSRTISKLLGIPEKYNVIVEFNSSRGIIDGNECYLIEDLKNKVNKVLGDNGFGFHEYSDLFFDEVGDFIEFLEKNNIPFYGNLRKGVFFCYFRDDMDKKRAILQSYVKSKKGSFNLDVPVQNERVESHNLVGEGRSVVKISEEIGIPPEKKMIEFIKKVEEDEIKESVKKSGREVMEKAREDMIKRAMEDEKFAGRDNNFPRREVERKIAEPDYNKIKDLMTNKFGFSKVPREVSFGPGVKERKFEEKNLEESKEDKKDIKDDKKDDDDINRIMTNRF